MSDAPATVAYVRALVPKAAPDAWGAAFLAFEQARGREWLRWRGDFYVFEVSAGHWQRVTDEEAKGTMHAFQRDRLAQQGAKGGEPSRFAVSNRTIAEMGGALMRTTLLPDGVEPPCWLHRYPAVRPFAYPAHEYVPFRNGLLEVPTLRLMPSTPHLWNTLALPFDWPTEAPDPPTAWLRFLETIWPRDTDARTSLQEWFGYLVTGRMDRHKILVINGPPRSGKGTIARTLERLVGAERTIWPTLSSLGKTFGLMPWIGKSVAFIGDARVGAKSDHSAIIEHLLSISGGDGQTIDRKHGAPWTGHLPTRIVILSNEITRLVDQSGAMQSRMHVLTTSRSFLGAEDYGLEGRILADLPGIMRWALEGAQMLAQRPNGFLVPSSSRSRIEEAQRTNAPVAAFLDDTCLFDPEAEIGNNDLYAAWVAWCEDEGIDRPGNVSTLLQGVHAARPEVEVTRRRASGGRVRGLRGITLRHERE